jgi:hypothetical protein
MRSNVEFRSPDLLDAQPGAGVPQGEAVATLLAEHLAHRGYSIEVVEPEDWGWRVQLHNAAFPLWIGCGHYEEYPDGHLCFIEPSKPYTGRWWKRIATEETVERLATAIEQVLRDSGKVYDLRWWTAAENARG